MNYVYLLCIIQQMCVIKLHLAFRRLHMLSFQFFVHYFHRAISRSARVNPDGPYIWCLAVNTNFGGKNLVTGTARGERCVRPLFEIPISLSYKSILICILRPPRTYSGRARPSPPPPPLPLSVANRPLRRAGRRAFPRRLLSSKPPVRAGGGP